MSAFHGAVYKNLVALLCKCQLVQRDVQLSYNDRTADFGTDFQAVAFDQVTN